MSGSSETKHVSRDKKHEEGRERTPLNILVEAPRRKPSSIPRLRAVMPSSAMMV